MITETVKILDCGHEPSEHESFTTGYGTDKNGKTYCYDCCAKSDMEVMRKYKAIDLYLSGEYVTNWPGSLKIKVGYQRKGKHNIAGSRVDVWFTFEGTQWHGVQYGEWTQICHCKQIKS
jgi:hypothetical protein